MKSSRRRFTILDMGLVIVITAIGLSLARQFLARYNDPRAGLSFLHSRFVLISCLVIGLTSRFVAPAMVGLLVARLGKPRPGRRRLSRQPGAVACAAASAAMLIDGLIVVSVAHVRGFEAPIHGPQPWPPFEERIPAAVIFAWLALAVGRRWRAEPSWVDRAGRLLGLYWIVLVLFRGAMNLLDIYLPSF